MSREFSVNHPILFILAGLAVLAVSAQSVVFLVRALRRAKELGYPRDKLRKLITASALFTIAPAIAIGIGIITLYGSLGLPLPWLRLSVVGALPYELSAAGTAANAVGAALGDSLTAQQFTTIAWTMTVGILTGLFLIPIFNRKVQNSLSSYESKDKAWGEHLINAIFFGLIATFVGVGVSGVTESAEGRVTALVLVVSALVMCICGLLKKKLGWKWLNDYALPICMIVAMAAAIPLSAVIR